MQKLEEEKTEQTSDPARPLTLHKGRNVIRGAVINGPGLSDFCVRFLDSGGQPVRGISLDVK